jgi:3-isopropylmalate/(R)-2-methylmalate dehydratase small subunit
VTRQPLRQIKGRTAVLLAEDVDTDQIIPARFLKGTSREGLGKHLFADRKDAPLHAGASVLVAGRNFGCGSSREHAVWALRDRGFQAVIAPSFADIFFANALKNGLVPVAVEPTVHAQLVATPGVEVLVDVQALRLLAPGAHVSFSLPAFARHCLVEGLDEMTFLLSQEAQIAAYERRTSVSPER